MKAIKYRVKVCEGTMDFIHGGGRWIDEIFILEKELCFNTEKGLNLFSSMEPRDTQRSHALIEKKEIEISDSIVKRLSLLLKSIERINKTKEGLLKEIKKVGIFEEEGA